MYSKKRFLGDLLVKLFGLVALLAMFVSSIGCQATPVTFAPYAGFGGYDGANNGYGGDNGTTWQIGVGASFTLGGTREYVTPVPGHSALPSAPSVVSVNNSQSQSQSQCNKCGRGHNPPCN
jgi:hypothetical protein